MSLYLIFVSTTNLLSLVFNKVVHLVKFMRVHLFPIIIILFESNYYKNDNGELTLLINLFFICTLSIFKSRNKDYFLTNLQTVIFCYEQL